MGDRLQTMRAAWLAVADSCDEVRPEWTPQMIGAWMALAVRDAVRPTGSVSEGIRAMCGQEDAPPPADVSLLALANRTLVAELEAARAEIERVTAERDAAVSFRAKLWDALGGHVASDPLEPLSEGAARVRRERDEARAEVERVTAERDAARWTLLALAERSDDIARRTGGVSDG